MSSEKINQDHSKKNFEKLENGQELKIWTISRSKKWIRLKKGQD